MTELKLWSPKHERGVADIDVLSQYPKLEVLEIETYSNINISITEHKHLHTLSLRRCILSIDTCRSFILSLQSPHYKLHKLTLYRCWISISDQTLQTTINARTPESIDVTAPLSLLDQMIPAIHPFPQLTELKLCIKTVDCEVNMEILENIHFNCPLLNTLIICVIGDSSFSLPLSILWFLGSSENDLNTLSLSRCVFSSNVTKSLIHSLQSTHSRLFKL